MKRTRSTFKKRLTLVLSIIMIIGLLPSTTLADDYASTDAVSFAAVAAADVNVNIQASKDAAGVTAALINNSAIGVSANLVLAVYEPNGRLCYNKDYIVTIGANDLASQRFDYNVAAHPEYIYKLFAWDPLSFAPLCKELRIGPPTVLFENGKWAPELGEITVHTPGLDSAWAYEDGLISMTNRVPVSKNVAFRFVFENLVDMRGYDAVVVELEKPPTGWFGAIVRFRIDQDACSVSLSHTNRIRMAVGTSVNLSGTNAMVGMSAGNWDTERLRGVGGLPAYGETVKIKKVYLEGNGYYNPATINTNAQNLMDIVPPRTGNTPVTSIVTSSQYYGKVEWTPNHSVFQPDTAYRANITIKPKPGWTLNGLAANWFRIYYPTGGAVQVTHTAGSGALSHTFPATKQLLPYPDSTQFVALSFDDIYVSDTEALVDALDKVGIKGTLFANGINIDKTRTNPVFKRGLDKAIAGGHEFGNHAYQHERYDNSADENVTRENFKKNQDVIRELTGQTARWCRIPYASHGTMSLRVTGEFGLTNLRGLATDDWDFPNSVSRLVNTVVTATGNNAIRDGQIYVCHNQPGQTNTIQAIPEYYHELRSRGVGFMTLSQLRAHRGFTADPGVNYANFFQNSATPQIITINTQPTAPAAINLTEGRISGSLTVAATGAQSAVLSYQWYAASFTGNTKINGATSASFALPADLKEGTYYYYCVVSASNAPSITTNVIPVTITAPLPSLLTVRPIATPVAGHFPASLFKYPYKANLYNNTSTTASVGNGFNQTLIWSPEITKVFQTNTEYTVTLTLEPNAGWTNCGMPGSTRSFSANNLAPAHIAGLPTEGVKRMTWQYDGVNLIINITFNATASVASPPDVIFYEDFSKGVHEDKTIGEGYFMMAQQANRQGLGNWRDAMTSVRVREDGGSELVLGYKKDPDAAPAGSTAYVKNNWITAGGVRTRGRTVAQGGGAYGLDNIIYENAFGYYEANIKFPQANVVWGAFWLFSPATAAPITVAEGGSKYATEIDIIETAGYLAKTYNAAYHVYRNSTDRNATTGPRRGPNPNRVLLYPGDPGYDTASRMAASEEVGIHSSAKATGVDLYDGKFHKIGLEWSPTDYIFSVDGVVIGSWQNLSSHYRSNSGVYTDWPWINQNEGVMQNPAYIKLTVEAAEWADTTNDRNWRDNPDNPWFGDGRLGIPNEPGAMVVDYVYILNGPKPATN